MIKIDKPQKCCGCTACYNVCPVHCIKMKPDCEGFFYPSVDEDKCINCSQCNNVCPIENKSKNLTMPIDGLILRSKNKNIVENSTSGGFFTSLANYVLNQNGVICGASFDEKFNVVHTIFDNNFSEGVTKLRGSKYVQSNLSDCYRRIKEYLKKGIKVCFSGTPCQVEGLKKYLGTNDKQLITVDVVCHGVPSPELWRKYLDYQKEKYGGFIKEVNFRKKTYGYHSGTMELIFFNGKKYNGSARIDIMLKAFFEGIALRPCCYSCAFKSISHCSDFTIFDCWSADKLVEGLQDDDNGYTNLIIQSEKGKSIFEQISNCYDFYWCDIQRMIDMDGIMINNNAIKNPFRDEFYKKMLENGLDSVINSYLTISKKDYIIEGLKGIAYRLHILNIIKHILK